MATLMQQLTNRLKWFNSSQRLPKKQHAYFLKTVAELLEQGFSLNQALAFLQLLLGKHSSLIQTVLDKLAQGETFEKSIQPLGYRVSVIAQLFYAQRQGRFVESLRDNATHLQRIRDYQVKTMKLLSYPIIMGCFLIGLLFGMRHFMLPHIMGFISQQTYNENILVQALVLFFTYLPQLAIGLLAIQLMIVGVIDLYLMRVSYMKRYQLLSRLPLIRKWVKLFCTYKVSKELGYFYKAGYSLQQLLDVLIQYPVDPFLAEVAQRLWQGLLQGMPLPNLIGECGIFTKEFGLVIYQGELTSQAASKCLVYADKLLNDLLEDISAKITYIQPVLFILIAVLVMAMYLMMLLPMLTMDGL